MNNKWPYNTTRWRKLRKQHLMEHPLCVYCAEMGRVTPATIVDHIKPVRDFPELAFEISNFQGLCPTDHSSVKKKEEARGARIGCDVDGNPVGGW